MQNRYDPKLAQPATLKQDEGYLVMSTGTNYVSMYGFGFYLYVAPFTAKYDQDLLANFVVASQISKSDFSDHFGLLHVLKLKAGTYQYYPRSGDYREYAITVPNARFNIVAGKVTYLGEFFYHNSVNWHMDIGDNEQRDIELLRQKNVQLAQLPRVKDIVQFSGFILKDNKHVEQVE